MRDSHENLKRRTKDFAPRVIRPATSLPRGKVSDVIQYQLLKSGTSVGANYRAACRAKSPKDFCSKMGTVEEEADESVYWMELIVEAGLVKEELVVELIREGIELTAIAVASINTSRKGEGRKSTDQSAKQIYSALRTQEGSYPSSNGLRPLGIHLHMPMPPK